MKSVHLRAFLTAAPTLVEGDIDLRRFTMEFRRTQRVDPIF